MRGAFEISNFKFEISEGTWLLNSEVKEKFIVDSRQFTVSSKKGREQSRPFLFAGVDDNLNA
jgi:hypothetical protein